MNLIELLSTPNELNMKILQIPLTIIEIYIYYKFFSHILKMNKVEKWKVCTYIFTYSTIATIINFYAIYLAFINQIILLLFLHFLFKQSIKRSILGLLITHVSFYISSCITEILTRLIWNISLNDIITIPLYNFIATTVILGLGYSFCHIGKLKSKISQTLSKVSFKTIVMANLISGLLAIFVQSSLVSTYKNNLPLNLIIINISSLVIYFSISIYGLIRTTQLEQTQSDLETEKIYNKTLSLLHDNIRCFKHDFNNIVQSIGGYIALNDMEGLKKYYNNLLEDCKETNNLNLLNPETINNPSIYSLLTNKYFLATEKGIKMTFNVFTDLNDINFNIYELTRILGILLDNAIEAAELTEEKLIEIELKSTEKKQLFIIRNSCADDNISTTKIFEKGYSTKEHNSGIGLWKVHKILSKNENVDLFTTVNNHKFTQQLEIFYNK